MIDDLSDMYELIAEHLLSGKVIPVLGPNLCDRRLREDIGEVSENVANRDGRLRLIQRRLMDIVDIVDPHARRVLSRLRNRLAAPSPQAVRVDFLVLAQRGDSL